MKTCIEPGCERPVDRDLGGARDRCHSHYRRWMRAQERKGFMRPGEVAAILGVSARTVERYWDRGYFTGKLVGLRPDRRIDVNSLRFWLEAVALEGHPHLTKAEAHVALARLRDVAA